MRVGSGVLKEEKNTDFFFFKPRVDDYTIKQLSLNSILRIVS